MHKGYLATLAASGLFVALASRFASAESPMDLKNHKPRFQWKTDAQGQHSISDGQMHVADFYGGA
jgi:hypothetical protein